MCQSASPIPPSRRSFISSTGWSLSHQSCNIKRLSSGLTLTLATLCAAFHPSLATIDSKRNVEVSECAVSSCLKPQQLVTRVALSFFRTQPCLQGCFLKWRRNTVRWCCSSSPRQQPSVVVVVAMTKSTAMLSFNNSMTCVVDVERKLVPHDPASCWLS